MRQKLNENPVAQLAVIALLLVVGGYFIYSNLSGGGSESESEAPPPATAEAGAAPEEASALEGAAPVSATSAVSAPTSQPLPKDVEAAYSEGKAIVLLIYRRGGIDDALVGIASQVLDGQPDVALFTAPASQVARYSAITGPLGINQVPALIVVRSRKLNGGGAAPATVTYGFQTPSDIIQAVVDSGYRGPQLTYAPQ